MNSKNLLRFFSALVVLAVGIAISGCSSSPSASAPATTSAPAAASASVPAAAASASAPGAPASVSAPAQGSPQSSAAAAPKVEPLKQLTTVKIASLQNTADLPFYIAQDRGYFKELNINPEFTVIDSGNKAIPGLSTGEFDVAGGAIGPGLFNAVARNIDIKIVADRAQVLPGTTFNAFVVRKDLQDKVKDYKDLKGLTIASNVKDSVTDLALEEALRRGGLTRSDIKETYMPFPEMLAGFANKGIDAAFTVEPQITIGQQKNLLFVFKQTAELTPGLEIGVTLYSAKFANNTDVAKAFMVAYLRGLRELNNSRTPAGREALNPIIAKDLHMDATLAPKIGLSLTDPMGRVNATNLNSIQDWYAGKGLVTHKVDLSKVIDMSFVDYANQVLGPVK